MQGVFSKLFYSLGLLMLVGLVVELFDRKFLYPQIDGNAFLAAQVGPLDPARPGVPMTALDFYPLTGSHTQANSCALFGSFCSGDHGFNIDFDLDNPPPKSPNRKRVIVIGGSGAWGHGASSNSRTFPRLMARQLNARRICADVEKVEIINLAANGSYTKQNAAILNQWGHKLAPDLILSFSGNNDLYAPVEPFVPGFEQVWLMAQSNLATSEVGWVNWLDETLPGFMTRTKLGPALRYLAYPDQPNVFWNETFANRFRYANAPSVEQGRIDSYVHGLQSIKRDFLGIPILVAYQPFLFRLGKRGAAGMPDAHIPEYLELYERFREVTSNRLKDYMNDQWRFVDVHQIMEETYLPHFDQKTATLDGVHLSNLEHGIVAKLLVPHVSELLCGQP